jgi:hypothetical protein
VVLTNHIGSTDVIVRGDWDSTNHRWKVASLGSAAEPKALASLLDRREATGRTGVDGSTRKQTKGEAGGEA